MSYTESDLYEARETGIRIAAESIRDMIEATAEEHLSCEHNFKDGAEAALQEVVALLPPGAAILSGFYNEPPD